MEKIFNCYSESDKLTFVRSFLATVLGQIPDFYLDFIGLQSEDTTFLIFALRRFFRMPTPCPSKSVLSQYFLISS
jgi:hypothetical protein